MSLEDEEALYYAEQNYEGEDEDVTYGDLLNMMANMMMDSMLRYWI